MRTNFEQILAQLEENQETLINQSNLIIEPGNGIFNRYQRPILTADHVPLNWRYDFNPITNPFLIERFGINAVMNSGAIKWNNKYILVARVEGIDRKSFFAVAESNNGIDNFKFFVRAMPHCAIAADWSPSLALSSLLSVQKRPYIQPSS